MSNQIHAVLKDQVSKDPVVLYMKGTPESPQCGFSAQVIKILNSYGVKYATYDVLEDWDIREGIKSFSNWPTIPQLYVNGKFVGGCDITSDLHRSGELKTILTGN